MKRLVAAVVMISGLGLAGAVAYRAVERDREYRRLIGQGDEALSRGQTYVAIEAFSGAIALKPALMRAYLKRGEAHRRRGDSRETLAAALRDFRNATELDPGATRPYEELGDVNLQLHRYTNASESYEAYLKLDDHSPSIFYKLALAARGEGRLTRAISSLRDAVRLSPGFAEAHYVLGMCLKDRGQFPEAQAALERSINLAPALIAAREELAEVHRLQGQTREELEQLEALAALDPGRPERQIAVGLAYSRAGIPDLAVTALRRAAERFHDYPGVYAALGEVWLGDADERGDRASLRKALEALEPVASQSTASSELLGLYGRGLALSGQYDAAGKILKRAMETFPIDPSVLLQFASVAERLGRLDESRQALMRYTELVDDDESVHAERIADLSMALNDPATAVSWYEKSEVLSSPDALVLAHLADAQARTGRIDAARSSIARAVQLDPDEPSVRAIALRIQHVAEPVPQKVEPEHQ